MSHLAAFLVGTFLGMALLTFLERWSYERDRAFNTPPTREWGG